MIDNEKLNNILENYKKYLPTHWKGIEDYKWNSLINFQKHWNMDADDFGEMFKQATDKKSMYTLLDSGYSYPGAMILKFAGKDDHAVRQMFNGLFDETQELIDRVRTFYSTAESIRAKYDDGTWKSHYQNTGAISTYLWLWKPEKYYIYRYEITRDMAKEIGADYVPKKDGMAKTLIDVYKFYDEVCDAIKQDTQIKDLLFSLSPEAAEIDPAMHTVVYDFAFYISKFYIPERKAKQDENAWFPKDYTPGLSVAQWTELLQDTSVFTIKALQIVKRIKDYGGQATCKQLATKYGESYNFYNAGSSALAQRIAQKTKCPVMNRDAENLRWWPILYMGRSADSSEEGSYIWRLRSELAQAIEQVDLSNIPLYVVNSAENDSALNHWWLTANPAIWSFSDIKVGEEQSYTLYNANGNKRRVFQNFLDAKVGDIVIGYESVPTKKIVAVCRITQANDGKAICFEKTEGLANPVEYQTLRDCSELDKMEFFVQPNGSLFKLTKGEFDFIMDIIRESNPLKPLNDNFTKYSREDFLSSVYMEEERYDELKELLERKKNIILQGAPGVGKTFTAKKLAYAMMGECDNTRIETVQFHQNYSYEDFIMGYRPEGTEFKLKEGIFYRFCKIAENHSEKDYFFIIDEINRGNLSKIFGELLMLIEKDHRGEKVKLAYSGESFSVPENLYIIGMMNTADRSLAIIDYALRRRFSFFNMEPGYNSSGFVKYQKGFESDTFDALINQINALNRAISDDKSLGAGFQIGHSYFCGKEIGQYTSDEIKRWLRSVVRYDIVPMLREYWFDTPKTADDWQETLESVFNDE